jgi:hypothetical protein
MSGTSSTPSVLPGQCIPALLFVVKDDVVDVSSAAGGGAADKDDKPGTAPPSLISQA